MLIVGKNIEVQVSIKESKLLQRSSGQDKLVVKIDVKCIQWDGIKCSKATIKIAVWKIHKFIYDFVDW